MSELINETAAKKAAAKDERIKNGYETVLNIVEDELQGAELLPGGLLRLNVADRCGDKFVEALKDIGSDVLKLGGGRSLWRSSTHAGTIYCEGLDPHNNIDDGWEEVIEDIKLRVEML